MHPTVVEALGRYLAKHKRMAGSCEYLFPSVKLGRLSSTSVNHTFHLLLSARTSLLDAPAGHASTTCGTPSQPGRWSNAA
jgi:hypothetical protein